MTEHTVISASQPDLEARVAFENRPEPERHVTKVTVRLTEPVAQDLQIEARGRFITHVDVWPTGAATAVISVEERLNLPTYARLRVGAPLSDAYDITLYTTEADEVTLNFELV